MDQARLALDYIDVIIWPLALVGIAVFVSVRFRQEIAGLISRIRSASLPLGLGIQVAEQDAGDSGEVPVVVSLLTETLERKEAEIAARTIAYGELTRTLAIFQVSYAFERIYRQSYGTQILLLHYLGTIGPEGASLEDLVTFHQRHLESARQAWPEYNYAFSSYVAFLTGNELIELREGRYHITDPGRGFLQWMRAEAVPVKPW